MSFHTFSAAQPIAFREFNPTLQRIMRKWPRPPAVPFPEDLGSEQLPLPQQEVPPVEGFSQSPPAPAPSHLTVVDSHDGASLYEEKLSSYEDDKDSADENDGYTNEVQGDENDSLLTNVHGNEEVSGREIIEEQIEARTTWGGDGVPGHNGMKCEGNYHFQTSVPHNGMLQGLNFDEGLENQCWTEAAAGLDANVHYGHFHGSFLRQEDVNTTTGITATNAGQLAFGDTFNLNFNTGPPSNVASSEQHAALYASPTPNKATYNEPERPSLNVNTDALQLYATVPQSGDTYLLSPHSSSSASSSSNWSQYELLPAISLHSRSSSSYSVASTSRSSEFPPSSLSSSLPTSWSRSAPLPAANAGSHTSRTHSAVNTIPGYQPGTSSLRAMQPRSFSRANVAPYSLLSRLSTSARKLVDDQLPMISHYSKSRRLSTPYASSSNLQLHPQPIRMPIQNGLYSNGATTSSAMNISRPSYGRAGAWLTSTVLNSGPYASTSMVRQPQPQVQTMAYPQPSGLLQSEGQPPAHMFQSGHGRMLAVGQDDESSWLS